MPWDYRRVPKKSLTSGTPASLQGSVSAGEYLSLLDDSRYNQQVSPSTIRFAEGDAVKAIRAFQEIMLQQAGMIMLIATSHVGEGDQAIFALCVRVV